MKDAKRKYGVGALLYTPALNQKIAGHIINGDFGDRYSAALCLEDTISPDLTGAAELQVRETLEELRRAKSSSAFFMPELFLRVREPEQAGRLYDLIRPCEDLLTGFIFPKYAPENADDYNRQILRINERAGKKLWMMPILESRDIACPATRFRTLETLRTTIDGMSEYVLNVRVGGNDFLNYFAARRHYDETIYDVLPLALLLGDILSWFGMDYVVSGPVWEFFGSANREWKDGLTEELKRDRLNGFVGKTVIHPRQIPVVNEMLKVTRKDHEDAMAILNWNGSGLQVGKSSGGERMNEVRTHYHWAVKIRLLSEIYGIL